MPQNTETWLILGWKSDLSSIQDHAEWSDRSVKPLDVADQEQIGLFKHPLMDFDGLGRSPPLLAQPLFGLPVV